MDRKRFATAVCILLAVMGLCLLSILATRSAVAQDSSLSNMQSHVERLVERMNGEGGFRIFINFEHPLVDDQLTWEIGNPNDELRRSIVEVGSDYLCFQEIALAADGRRCTPFANITSVFYLNN